MHYERNDLTDAVLAQLEAVPEVFVFDDGSSAPYTSSKPIILRVDRNQGYVKAVNLAMERLSYLCLDAVWVLNNDVTGLTPALWSALIEALVRNKHLAAVSPAVRRSGHIEMRPGREFRGRVDPKARREKFIDWVCPMVRVKAWNDVGGFDENLAGYGVDLDFCKRARDREWRFAVLPQFTIDHLSGGTVKGMPDKASHSDLALMNRLLCAKWGIRRWEDLKR